MQIFGIWLFLRSLNLAFVVTKWSQHVTWKSGCFSAFERGDFLKNYGVLQVSLTTTISSGLIDLLLVRSRVFSESSRMRWIFHLMSPLFYWQVLIICYAVIFAYI